MARNFSALENICPYTNRNGAKYCLYHGFEDSYNYTLHLGCLIFKNQIIKQYIKTNILTIPIIPSLYYPNCVIIIIIIIIILK